MKILFIHTWGMGDLIMLTPALRALHERYPNIQIDFLITTRAALFPIKKCSWINNIFYCENSPKAFLKTLPKLRRTRYDYGLVTSGVKPWKSSFFMSLLRIDNKIGEYWNKPNSLVFNYNYKFDKTQHRLTSNIKLLSKLIDKNVSKQPFFCLDKEDYDFADKYIEENFLKESTLFGIHPGCNKSTSYRRWPVEHYIKLIKMLQETSLTPLLFIGPDESDLGDLIRNKTNIQVVRDTTMYQTASLLSKCKFFLNSDSGLGHVASCFDVELFIIFGPADDRITKPLSAKTHILRSNIPLPPEETWLKLTNPPKCLTDYYPEEVFGYIKDNIDKKYFKEGK
jgi:heptosyltransferase-2